MKEITVHGQSRRYYHSRVGINARIDTIQAAILLAKLDIFPEEVDCGKIGRQYSSLSTTLSEYRHTLPCSGKYSVYAQYTIQLKTVNRSNNYWQIMIFNSGSLSCSPEQAARVRD